MVLVESRAVRAASERPEVVVRQMLEERESVMVERSVEEESQRACET